MKGKVFKVFTISLVTGLSMYLQGCPSAFDGVPVPAASASAVPNQ
jgi:hypothetical protein